MLDQELVVLWTMEAERNKALYRRFKTSVAILYTNGYYQILVAGNIAIKYGLRGTCTAVVTACATGTNNIGDAFRLIKHGYADVMLAGGGEAPITRSVLLDLLEWKR